MKINNISLLSNDFQTPGTLIVNLPFRDPSGLSPYIVKGVFGLDADEIIPQLYGINTTNYAFSGVGRPNIYRMHMAKRTLVIRLGLNPNNTNNETYSSLRDRLYKAISASRSGLVTVTMNDGESEVARTSGHIVKLEASHFEQKPELQLTIECDQPMMQAPSDVVLAPPVFDPDGLPNEGVLQVDDDVSTAPHGAVFVIEITADVEGFYIHDDTDEESENKLIFELAPGPYLLRDEDGFLQNDVITIDSRPGKLSVLLQDEGVGTPISIAHIVTPSSVWPVIFPGMNELYISPDADVTEVSYTPTFWGV